MYPTVIALSLTPGSFVVAAAPPAGPAPPSPSAITVTATATSAPTDLCRGLLTCFPPGLRTVRRLSAALVLVSADRTTPTCRCPSRAHRLYLHVGSPRSASSGGAPSADRVDEDADCPRDGAGRVVRVEAPLDDKALERGDVPEHVEQAC